MILITIPDVLKKLINLALNIENLNLTYQSFSIN